MRLIARNEAYDDGIERAGELMRAGDMDALQALMDKGREASDRVREVNRRYARQIEPMLPEGARPGFGEAVNRASFPEVYRPTHARRVLDAAVALDGLDENQAASVRAIAEGYARDLAAANREMAAAIEEREKTMDARQLMRGGRGRGRGDGMEALYEARRALEESTLESLRKVLTEEQFAKMPERGERREGPEGGRGPGRSGEDEEGRPQRRRPPSDT